MQSRYDRRRFLYNAIMTLGATELSMFTVTHSQQVADKGKPEATGLKGFGPLKQITAGVLNVGYVEQGSLDGPVVILLHGWPYDIHSFVEVSPLLTAAGYRVIIPYLRGY